MISPFHLTRRAALDLRDIHRRSCQEWGDDTGDRYIADLYAAIAKAAKNPDIGLLRQRRSTPFMMIPARKHFVIYDRIPEGIVVLTLLHQVRDIEALIADLTPAFMQEVNRLRGNL